MEKRYPSHRDGEFRDKSLERELLARRAQSKGDIRSNKALSFFALSVNSDSVDIIGLGLMIGDRGNTGTRRNAVAW